MEVIALSVHIKRYHVEKDAIIGYDHIKQGTIKGAQLAASFMQWGRASVSFPFAAAGEENVSAAISFLLLSSV